MSRTRRLLAATALLGLVAAGCGEDDGATVRELEDSSGGGSGSGSGSGSGHGSGSVPASGSGSGSAPATTPAG